MRSIYLAATFLLLTNCYKTSRHCEDYKTGMFRFNYVVDGVEKTSYFKRTDSFNINYYDNKIDSSRVKWINRCEFVLYEINSKSIIRKSPIQYKILTTNDSTYTFEYSKASLNPGEKKRVEKGIAYKINSK